MTRAPAEQNTTRPDPLRRRLLQASLAASGLALSGWPALSAALEKPLLAFRPLAVSSENAVHVPAGYRVQLLYAWGDPVSDGPAFRADAGNSAADQALQAGMNHDGMHFFPFVEDGQPSSTHGLMCVNHEDTDEALLHPDGRTEWSHAKTLKSQNAHGVSVIEVRRKAGATAGWQVVRPSSYARRITARTPLRISGPAAGAPAMRTKDDRRGNVVFGTLANCAMGVTPWGTYLSCEENFHSYFNGLTTPSAEQQRYGIDVQGGDGRRWHEHDSRFDVATEANEANRFGWVVEIDPWNPAKAPVKRTALGRFKHECATLTLARDGRVVVYLSDDEGFEYLYKYVSRGRFDASKGAANGDLLDFGTLYAARFGDDGHGQWLALEHGENGLNEAAGFADQADVLIRTRQAADRVGATKMDCGEGIAVHPHSGEVYCSLTSNRQRVSVDAANPRPANAFGHLIRWREDGQDASAGTFAWDIFALCGDPQNADEKKRGNVRGDAFANPDGLGFDREGRLWIQTDISGSVIRRGDFSRLGNNQMLVADTASGEVRRFLTGPEACEVTGISFTPDGRNLFINIQHPAAAPGSAAAGAWPASQFGGQSGSRPRSATIVITREDGRIVGS